MVGWESLSSVMTSGRKKVQTHKAVSNFVNNFDALACNVCPSLTSQTKPLLRKGKATELCIQVVSTGL